MNSLFLPSITIIIRIIYSVNFFLSTEEGVGAIGELNWTSSNSFFFVQNKHISHNFIIYPICNLLIWIFKLFQESMKGITWWSSSIIMLMTTIYLETHRLLRTYYKLINQLKFNGLQKSNGYDENDFGYTEGY